MNRKINPCISFRKNGTRGEKGKLYDFKTEILHQCGEEAVLIYVGKLDKDAWDYGYEVHIPGKNVIKRMPGSSDSWFEKENYATLYALHAVRIGFWNQISVKAKISIKEAITREMSPTLF